MFNFSPNFDLQQEQARRGDMDVSTSTLALGYLKIYAVSFLNSVFSMSANNAIGELGLSRNVSVGSTSTIRAELPGYNIR